MLFMRMIKYICMLDGSIELIRQKNYLGAVAAALSTIFGPLLIGLKIKSYCNQKQTYLLLSDDGFKYGNQRLIPWNEVDKIEVGTSMYLQNEQESD